MRWLDTGNCPAHPQHGFVLLGLGQLDVVDMLLKVILHRRLDHQHSQEVALFVCIAGNLAGPHFDIANAPNHRVILRDGSRHPRQSKGQRQQ